MLGWYVVVLAAMSGSQIRVIVVLLAMLRVIVVFAAIRGSPFG